MNEKVKEFGIIQKLYVTIIDYNLLLKFIFKTYFDEISPQAPDRFNPKVNPQTCGIIQMLYETKQIKTMMFSKSVIAHILKIEPKTSKQGMKKWLKRGKNGFKFLLGCHIC